MEPVLMALIAIIVNILDPLMWLAAIPAFLRPKNRVLVGLGGIAVGGLNFLIIRSVAAYRGMQISSDAAMGKILAAVFIAYGVAALRNWRLSRTAAKADDWPSKL